MRFLVVLLAVIGAGLGLKEQPRPPQSNPNFDTESEGNVKKKSSDPAVSVFKDVDNTNGLSDAACNMRSIIAASGNNLATMVKSASSQCVNGVFDLSGTDARNACNEADMITIADSLYGESYNYDPANPSKTSGMLSLVTYLRGCYYIYGSYEKDIGKYTSNVLTRVRYGIDNFFKRPNLDAKNDVHYLNADQMISLISNAHDYINYAGQLAQLLTKLGNAWRFESSVFIQKATQGDVILSIHDIFHRSHYEKAQATAYYCKHPEIPQAFNDFTNKQSGLVGQKSEWILRNNAGELAKFLQYPCLYSQVSRMVKDQLAKYGPNKGEKIWAAMASQIDYFVPKNCAEFNVCNFKVSLEKKILSYTKTCPKTRTDTFIIRAQQLSENEATEVCMRLKAQENHFHTLVKDNWRPVTPDTNDRIEVVIFASVDDYKFYASTIFGISTDNGGMYMEGNPSKSGNIARYYCYKKPRNGKFDVWNLEHEFTHYLDGRYDMKGDFTETSKGRTIWWIEGFGEYAANKNQYTSMVDDCKQQLYPLSTIFSNTYSSGQNRIYHYGYLAARFMFERHRADVDTILGYFRSARFRDYETWFNGIFNRYDSEFSQWCKCIANGRPC